MTPLPLTPAEFQEVWLQLLAAGTGADHAGRLLADLFTDDEVEKFLGPEITERLKATTRLFKAALQADPADLS